MNHRLVLSVVAAVLLFVGSAGCGSSLVPMTQELRMQHQLTNNDLKNLQFYLSHEVVLRRELESGGRQVTGSHKLVLIAGKMIEEVEIPKRTPGVAVAVEPDRIWVSFEEGTALPFTLREGGSVHAAPTSVSFELQPTAEPFPGNATSRGPEPFPGAVGGTGNFWLTVEPGTRQIQFNGKLFEAVGRSFKAHLLIDADSLEEVEENKRVLPGMKLGD